MNRYVGTALGLTLALGILNAQAQQKSEGVRTRTITFETNDYSYKQDIASTGKNSLTIGLVSWLNGYVPVYYERALTNFLSLRLGGGLTLRSYGNDFGQMIHEDGEQSLYFNNGDPNLGDITDQYENYKYRKSKPGYYLSIAPRLYFDDNIMDGFTVGPVLEYKRFNDAAQLANVSVPEINAYDENSVPRVANTMKEYMNCLDFTLNIGGHYQADNHMVIAWTMGFGVRNLKARRQDLGYSMGNGADHYVNAVNSYSSVRPLLTFDFLVGGWF